MIVSDPDELVGLVTGPVRERLSILAEPDPLVIDLAGDLGDGAGAVADALDRLATPTLLVGTPADSPPPLEAAADVCVTAEPDPPAPWVRGDAELLRTCVARQPEAALTLVRVLRMTGRLPVGDGIAAESAAYALLLGSRPFRHWLEGRGERSPKPHGEQVVGVTRAGSVLRICLDRPEARNALDTAMRDQLVDAVAIAVSDPSLRVELRGSGESFCSGGDLAEFGTTTDPATAHAVRLTRHPGSFLAEVADRLTCFVQGACAGAGVELPAFAGRVVADPDTTFCLPEMAMGLIPGAGGTVSITRRVGRQRAAWLALTGTAIDAATALRWGLVDEVAAARGPAPSDCI